MDITLFLMIMETVFFMAAQLLIRNVLEKIFIERKNEIKKIDNKLLIRIICTIVMIVVSILNLFLNCTFLEFAEQVRYAIGFCVFYLVSAVFYSSIYKGAEYKKKKPDKKVSRTLAITAVLFTIFLIYTITNIQISAGV